MDIAALLIPNKKTRATFAEYCLALPPKSNYLFLTYFLPNIRSLLKSGFSDNLLTNVQLRPNERPNKTLLLVITYINLTYTYRNKRHSLSDITSSLSPPGIPRVDCSADGDICLCGGFHVCGRGQGLCQGERLDLLCVLRYFLRISLCDQLLRKLSQKTSLEPGGIGKPAHMLIIFF